MAKLLLSTAEGQQAIDLRAVNSLGRHPNNTIQLLDKIVSKEHCIVEVRDGRFVLRDLGSLNGTYVNGERVRGEMPLKHGDEIALGSTRARFDDGSGAALPLPPVGPGAVQNPMGSWPQANVTAPHSPQALSGQQMLQPPPMRAPSYSQPSYPSQSVPTTAVPVPGAPQQQQPIPSGTQAYPGAPQRPSPATPMNAVPPNMPGMAPPLAQATPRPHLGGTRVDVLDAARAIGTQIAAQTKGFLPFEAIANDAKQLKLDYERLRITWELTRDIGLERDLDTLLDKILLALFKFTKADRGVIMLRENDGTLSPRAARRRDGTTTAIQVSSTILNHAIAERMGVITHDASMDFASSKGKSMILNRISSAMVVPLLHENEKEVLGVVWLDSESLAQFQPKDLELITSVAGQAAMFIENTILAKKVEQEIVVRDRFTRLVAPNVAEQMISGKLEVKKGGQLIQELTIYNSDIRGFTAMSEGTPAETLVEMLNEYFELMVETLFKYEGTLDKFMGDGIMAFWGAPVVHRDDAVRCVQCALDQMEVLGRFNRERLASGKPGLAVGLGIHTGPGVVGYVGSSKALSYTTIGDTANTSARLCSSAASGQIVISEATLSKLGGRFEFEEIEAKSLKGKEKPMRRFNILREKPSAVARVS
ncbi:MAG TPA: adenylate/guanylate cyclase domain-containing protein [Polyangiaceae bacterium]|jgi:adenylate cyclase|nr:adenylate/guanylate cyclase domain-containing protein [Polyangiaceae bacterium]